MASSVLAERLRRIREDKGFTQIDLADKLGVTNTVLSNYERGIREPDFAFVSRFASFFGISVDYLFGRSIDTSTVPTQALHREGNVDEPLPAEALAELEQFTQWLREKYKKK